MEVVQAEIDIESVGSQRHILGVIGGDIFSQLCIIMLSKELI